MKFLSRFVIGISVIVPLFFVISIQFAQAVECSFSGTGTWSTNYVNLNENVVAKIPEQNCNGRAITLKFYGKSTSGDFHIKDISILGQISAVADGYVSFSASDFQGRTGDIQVYFIPQTSNGSATGSSSQLLTVSLTNNGSTTTGVLNLNFDAMPGVSPKIIPADKQVPIILTLTLNTTQFGQYCNDINTTSFRWSIYQSYPGIAIADGKVYPPGLNPLGQVESFVRSATPISKTLTATVTAFVSGQSSSGFYALIECGSINNIGTHTNVAQSAPVLFNVGTGQSIWSCVAPNGTGGYAYACSPNNLPDCSDVKNATTGANLCAPNNCRQISSSLCGSSAPPPGTGGGGGGTCGGAGQPVCIPPPGGGGGTGGTCQNSVCTNGVGPCRDDSDCSTGNCGGAGQPTCPPISGTATQSFTFTIDNPLAGGPNDLFDIIDIVTQWIIYISVPLAVLWIMYAGFLMLTAGPVPANFQKGRDILKYTVIGLAIIFIGKGFISLIISVIELGGTSPPPSQSLCVNGFCTNKPGVSCTADPTICNQP